MNPKALHFARELKAFGTLPKALDCVHMTGRHNFDLSAQVSYIASICAVAFSQSDSDLEDYLLENILRASFEYENEGAAQFLADIIRCYNEL